jgi:hypothetical protein
VQFADFSVPLGEPCPRCAGTEIVRDSKRFGHCAVCRATLILEDPTPQDESTDTEPARGSAQRSSRSEYGEILSGRVLSAQGEEAESLPLEEEAVVEILLLFPIPGVQVIVHVGLFAGRLKAFYWHTTFTVEEAGSYRVAVRVPPGLLAEREYRARISAQLELGEDVVRVYVRPHPTFKTYGPENDFARRDGAVRPDLDWELVRVGGVHDAPEPAAS